MNQQPSTNGPNGRSPGGRFAKGNRYGRGNPYVTRIAALRTALYEAVTPRDLAAVVRRLVERAKEGDVAAVRELLSRLLGPSDAVDLLERIERIESAMKNEKEKLT